jgi:hypothetical protein
MATGSVALELLQGRIEISEGTAASTATRILYVGPAGGIDPSGIQKRTIVEDRRAWGKRTGLAAVYSGIESNTLGITGIPISYEQIGWWLTLLAPSGGGVPGTVDTSAYTRTFTPVEGTAVNTFGTGYRTAYLEFSTLDFSSTLVQKMPAMRVSNITFNFNKRASGTDTGATMDLELMMGLGTATNGTAFSTALADATNTLVIGNQFTSYVDTTTLGTTADNNVSQARFSLANPLSFHDGFDGTRGHTSAHHSQQWTPTMTVTRKFSDLTELNAYLAGTTRKVRLAAEGGVVGAATATNQFRFDFVGSPMDHRRTEVDGLVYAEIDLEGIYDSTLTTSWEAYLRNGVAAAYTAT